MPLGRAGSIPVIRISIIDTEADLAQLAERFTSNEEVAGSNPVVGIPCEYSSAGRTLPCHGRKSVRIPLFASILEVLNNMHL